MIKMLAESSLLGYICSELYTYKSVTDMDIFKLSTLLSPSVFKIEQILG